MKTCPVWARQVPLPLGLSSADRVIAVSPSYAQEIMTPEFGCSLETFLQSRQDTVMGILNGLDQVQLGPNDRSGYSRSVLAPKTLKTAWKIAKR